MSTFNVSEYILVCLAELLQGKNNSIIDHKVVCTIYMYAHNRLNANQRILHDCLH